MNRAQKTPASTAIPARAERGTAWGLSTPCGYRTMPGPEGQGKIADLLGHGQGAAVPLRHLVSVTGQDARTIRRRIERERRQGVPILSDNRRGYYLPAEEQEITACVRSLRRRAREILRTAQALNRAGGDWHG